MKKLGRKGFMLAEVVVVATVISVILVTLYIGLNRVTSAYETRNRYYDIDAMQIAMEVNDYIDRNHISITTASQLSIADLENSLLTPYKVSSGYSNVKIYYVPYTDITTFTTSLKNDSSVMNTFKDYIDYLNNNLGNCNYVLIVELQKDRNDENSYYYYTLKVGDGNA